MGLGCKAVASSSQKKATFPKQTSEFAARCFPFEGPFDITQIDSFAEKLKNWALEQGATHFCHWFQPLTGAPAEKHDAFLGFDRFRSPIDQFRGADLLKGEPDASSLPSGGLRSTHQARGYTMWDLSSPPFLWERGGSLILCLPAFYFSWEGDALDHRIPLHRSEEKINHQVQRLFSLCKVEGERVYATLGPEQEYFLIDRKLFLERPDLVLAGRTVYGARPPKGQELEEHYFGVVKSRVLSFMKGFEDRAKVLGIPLKTGHNEVAPAQHEVAPIYERALRASDHNLLLMEIMRQTAEEHGLSCLFGEKPFARVNGSGKHCNWSLETEGGQNLFSPREDSLLFLTLLTSVIRAVWEHGGLLRASVATLGNDHRLGGAEAPPVIPSLYLGKKLEDLVRALIEEKEGDQAVLRKIHLGLSHVPLVDADFSDRNRTAFLAFTGNKFELRAVGASQHPAFPVCILNAIVADALSLILDEMARAIGDETEIFPEKRFALCLPVLQKHLRLASGAIFGGNGYAPSWREEAAKRGLTHIEKSLDALGFLHEKRSRRALEGILSDRELEARFEIFVERYVLGLEVEIRLMIELFRTKIFPAALQDQKRRGEAIQAVAPLSTPREQVAIQELIETIEQSLEAIDELEEAFSLTRDLKLHAKAKALTDLVVPKMAKARQAVDFLETRVDETLWPLPQYRKLLFSV